MIKYDRAFVLPTEYIKAIEVGGVFYPNFMDNSKDSYVILAIDYMYNTVYCDEYDTNAHAIADELTKDE